MSLEAFHLETNMLKQKHSYPSLFRQLARTCALGSLLSGAAAGMQISIDPARELMVTDVSVVEAHGFTGPGEEWHFGTMMRRIAGDVPVDSFVQDWLDTWSTPQSVNGHRIFDPIQKDAMETFVDVWRTVGGLVQPGDVNVDLAPMRLLAIVNRPDLLRIRDGQIETAGEMRFVYGAHDRVGKGGRLPFFVIFEFDVPATSCEEVTDWHSRWHDLASVPLGSSEYLARLADLSRSVTTPSGAILRPNRSNLAQLRTNSFLKPSALPINLAFWELREFAIDGASSPAHSGGLIPATTKQTPSFLFTQGGQPPLYQAVLEEWLTVEHDNILMGDFTVPETFNSAIAGGAFPLLGGQAQNDLFLQDNFPGGTMLDAGPTRWWAGVYGGPTLEAFSAGPPERIEVRHQFALQTCSGCHGDETATGFVMVENRNAGEESKLAGFLTGILAMDKFVVPVGGTGIITRPFNDLENRSNQLLKILQLGCQTPVDPGSQSPLEVLQSVRASIGSRVH